MISEIYLKKNYSTDYSIYISQYFIVSLCIALIIFIFIEFLPVILDIVIPLNETRPRSIHVEAEYFVDLEKYFFLIVLHELITCLVGFSTLVATGTIIMAYVHHGCGMLKIVRWEKSIIILSDSLYNWLYNQKKFVASEYNMCWERT